jgi:FLVCR family MFS transporter 7
MNDLDHDNEVSRITSNDGILQHMAPIAEDVPEGSVSAEEREGETAREGGRMKRKPKRKQSYSQTHFKVYKRRWFGLAQLCLLNIVVSWDVSILLIRSKCLSHKWHGCKTRWQYM